MTKPPCESKRRAMKTILVVDDETALRINLCEMLTFEGFRVLEAVNGIEALALIQAHLPDLVICDVTMPNMDGFEVLTRLRRDPATAAIPVLLLTALADQPAIQHGLDLGAANYILKPFSFDDVLAKVQRYLGGEEQ